MSSIVAVLAMVSMLLGLILIASPFPGGALFLAGGLTALICSNASARFCVMWIRARLDWFNKLIFWFERTVGRRIKTIGIALAKTHPQNDKSTLISHRDFLANELKEGDQ